MQEVGKLIIYLAGGAFLLMFVYQLFGHPTAVTSEFKALSGFVTEESKILEGR